MQTKFIDSTDSIIKRYFKDIKGKNTVLSQDEEIELATKIKNGDSRAMTKLINSNLNFVVSVAKEYQGYGTPLPDLINDGNLGLIKAAQRFDHTRGFKFISYAIWWVKQSIIQELNKTSREIRLPANVINNLAKINKKILEMDSTTTSNLISETNGYYPQITSLNTVINEDGVELNEIIPEEPTDDNKYEGVIIKKELARILNGLSLREQEILQLYYGLDESIEPLTLGAIGEKFDLTKERVRQIKEKAIIKLRDKSINLISLLKN